MQTVSTDITSNQSANSGSYSADLSAQRRAAFKLPGKMQSLAAAVLGYFAFDTLPVAHAQAITVLPNPRTAAPATDIARAAISTSPIVSLGPSSKIDPIRVDPYNKDSVIQAHKVYYRGSEGGISDEPEKGTGGDFTTNRLGKIEYILDNTKGQKQRAEVLLNLARAQVGVAPATFDPELCKFAANAAAPWSILGTWTHHLNAVDPKYAPYITDVMIQAGRGCLGSFSSTAQFSIYDWVDDNHDQRAHERVLLGNYVYGIFDACFFTPSGENMGGKSAMSRRMLSQNTPRDKLTINRDFYCKRGYILSSGIFGAPPDITVMASGADFSQARLKVSFNGGPFTESRIIALDNVWGDPAVLVRFRSGTWSGARYDWRLENVKQDGVTKTFSDWVEFFSMPTPLPESKITSSRMVGDSFVVTEFSPEDAIVKFFWSQDLKTWKELGAVTKECPSEDFLLKPPGGEFKPGEPVFFKSEITKVPARLIPAQ